MPRYAMVIDRQRCVGCGACSIACRNENNVTEGVYWSHKITENIRGVFPMSGSITSPPCATTAPMLPA
jgi:Fe-S-cluster-containing dehydrogenase component